jgi:hypothetical protein
VVKRSPPPPRRPFGPLTGPIAAANRALPGRSPGELDAAGLLAKALDLRGSVELGVRVDGLGGAGRVEHDPCATTRSRLEEAAVSARAQLADLESDVRARVERWTSPRSRVAGRDVAARVLSTPGTWDDRARALVAPIADEATREFENARAVLRSVRAELGVAMRGLGGETAALEGLDAALGEGIASAVDRRLAAGLALAQRGFAGRLGAQLATSTELEPSELGVQHTTPRVLRVVLAALQDAVATTEAFLLGVLAVERRRLDALVGAALRLAEGAA